MPEPDFQGLLFPRVLPVIPGVEKVSSSCPNLLHYLSAHRYIAGTVQSKASCTLSQPHAESGLGPLALTCGYLNRPS